VITFDFRCFETEAINDYDICFEPPLKKKTSLPGIDCVTVNADEQDEQGLEKNTHISTLSAKT